MNTKKEKIRSAFDDVFGIEDKYFGEWFIKAEDDLTQFLVSLPDREKLFTQFRYLYLYLESLETNGVSHHYASKKRGQSRLIPTFCYTFYTMPITYRIVAVPIFQ